MLSPAQIEKVGLFFALALLNQKQATLAAGKVVASFKVAALLKKSKQVEANDVQLIGKCCSVLKKYSSNGAPIDIGEGFLRRAIDLGPWQRFRKEAEADEFLALLLHRILGFSEDDISRALGVTPGTIHYRTSKGAVHLGLLARAQ